MGYENFNEYTLISDVIHGIKQNDTSVTSEFDDLPYSTNYEDVASIYKTLNRDLLSNDFTHKFTVDLESGYGVLALIWFISSGTSDYTNLWHSQHPGIGLSFEPSVLPCYIRLRDYKRVLDAPLISGVTSLYIPTYSSKTVYVNINRTGYTLTAGVYNDSDYTSLICLRQLTIDSGSDYFDTLWPLRVAAANTHLDYHSITIRDAIYGETYCASALTASGNLGGFLYGGHIDYSGVLTSDAVVGGYVHTTKKMQASLEAVSVLSAHTTNYFGGHIYGTSQVTGILTNYHPPIDLSGILTGEIYATGEPYIATAQHLQSNVRATGLLNGDITRTLLCKSTLQAHSSFDVNFESTPLCGGLLFGESFIGGTLSRFHYNNISGVISSSSMITGILQANTRIRAVSDFTGNLGVRYVVNGQIVGISDFIAAMSTRFGSGMPLYSLGHMLASSGISLYTRGALLIRDGLNLYIRSAYPSLTNTIPLYIQNDYKTTNIPLIIRGAGVTDGAFPYSAGLTMVINPFDGKYYRAGIPLSIRTIDGYSTGGLNMSIVGTNIFSSGLPLCLPSAFATHLNSLILYTHGF